MIDRLKRATVMTPVLSAQSSRTKKAGRFKNRVATGAYSSLGTFSKKCWQLEKNIVYMCIVHAITYLSILVLYFHTNFICTCIVFLISLLLFFLSTSSLLKVSCGQMLWISILLETLSALHLVLVHDCMLQHQCYCYGHVNYLNIQWTKKAEKAPVQFQYGSCMERPVWTRDSLVNKI